MNILAILVGLFSGALGGFFGISGAFAIITALSLFNMVPNQKTAAGTTLLTILPPVSLLAVYVYWKNKEMDVNLALTMMGFYAIGGGIGAYMSSSISDKSLKLYVSVMFFILGIISFVSYTRVKKNATLNFGQKITGINPFLV